MITQATIVAVAGAVSAVCQLLMLPAGQRLLNIWIDDAERFRRDWAVLSKWIARQVGD